MDTKELTRGDYEELAAKYMQGCDNAPLVFVLPGVPVLWVAYEDYVADPEDGPGDFYHHECPIDESIGYELPSPDEVVDIDDLPF